VPIVIHLHTPTEFVLTANGWADDLAAHAPVIELERAVIRAADAWLSPSRFLARIAESHYELDADAVDVIPYPMGDADVIHRDEHTWRDGTIYYAGRLEPRKGVLEWVDAATSIAQDRPAHFTFIGRDTWPACRPGGSVRAAMLARVPRRLRRQVRFVDAVARPRLVGHLAGARMAVVPSRWENFPNTCIEAMASGLPVLVSPSGGMAEMVEDGRTGWIAAGSDARSLETTLRRALATPPSILASMGAAAATSIRALCDSREIVRRQIEFRRRIVARGCRAPGAISMRLAPLAAQALDRATGLPRLPQGRTMTAAEILRASPKQQLAILRRAVANPGYVFQWLAWHRRRLFAKGR
jgi:glycosyltransferase involved in cell wall biosynthesis